jgi:DNA-binding transcriptional regulator YdaS (Cro superfamily)
LGTRDTYQRTLVQACMTAGDETELAKRLGVPVPAVVDWLLGHKPVPPEIFLRAVDVVLAASRQHVEAVSEFLEQLRRRHPVKPR